jgi:hypothetical protein
VRGAEEARNRIVAFNNAYVRYVEARASGQAEEAHRLQMEMAIVGERCPSFAKLRRDVRWLVSQVRAAGSGARNPST